MSQRSRGLLEVLVGRVDVAMPHAHRDVGPEALTGGLDRDEALDLVVPVGADPAPSAVELDGLGVLLELEAEEPEPVAVGIDAQEEGFGHHAVDRRRAISATDAFGLHD